MSQLAYELVVLVVVVSVLNVVASHHFDLAHARILLPVEEIMLLEQLLLVELELPHLGYAPRCVVIPARLRACSAASLLSTEDE